MRLRRRSRAVGRIPREGTDHAVGWDVERGWGAVADPWPYGLSENVPRNTAYGIDVILSAIVVTFTLPFTLLPAGRQRHLRTNARLTANSAVKVAKIAKIANFL